MLGEAVGDGIITSSGSLLVGVADGNDTGLQDGNSSSYVSFLLFGFGMFVPTRFV